MHEDAPIIEASKREKLGSRYADRLRKSGRLPAVVYGHKQDPVAVDLDHISAVRQIEGGDRIFRMALDGGEPEFVLLKDLQFDHLGTHVVHADFARVDLDERMNVRVRLEFKGDAVGLKSAGAVMMHPLTELEIECSLFNLPEFIEVDVSELELHGSVSASEVKLPKETMVLITDPEAVVAQIVEKKAEAEAEESEVAAAAQPEVLTEKKKEEEAS